MIKVYNFLRKIYGVCMSISFFGGLVPLIPYIIAIIIGGTTGEAISLFLFDKIYPFIIALGSISIIIGLVIVYLEPLVKKKATDTPIESNGK